MTNIEFIQATPDDSARLADVRIRFLTDLFGPPEEAAAAVLRRSLIDYFSVAIAASTYICWLAQVAGEITGMGGMALRQYPGNFKNPEGRNGYILNMYTHPRYRRRGIGSGILERLIATARAQGVHSFELHATADGEPLYQQAGFLRHQEPTYRKWIEAAL